MSPRPFILTLSLFRLLGFDLYSQTFQHTYGGTGVERAFSTIQANDGSYAFTGSTSTLGAGGADVYLIKTNTASGTLMVNAFGGAGNDVGYSIAQTSEGGYIIAGSTASFGAGGLDFYLLKTTSDGTLSWSATFGGAGDDEAACVVQTSDGGYVITGYSKSFTGGSKDVYLVKTNSDASIFWGKTYGAATDYDDEGYSVIIDTDGGYVITGYTQSYGSVGNNNVYAIKTDESGTAAWSRVVSGANNDIGYDLMQTTDGGYLIVGGTNSPGFPGGYEIYLVMLNNAGAVSWDRIIGDANAATNEIGTGVVQVSDGSYCITGYTNSFGAGLKDALLTRVSFSGGSTTIHWAKAMGGTNNEDGKSVAVTSDGGFLVAGLTASFGTTADEVYFIKTNSVGVSGCNSVDPGSMMVVLVGAANTTGVLAGTGGSSSSGGTSSNAGSNIQYNACTNTALPVELLNFNGNKINNTVHLNWSTSSEFNNSHFIIERNTDQGENNWEAIGVVYGAGNSSIEKKYTFIDGILPSPSGEGLGVRFYRLKQTDHNGSYEYFGPIAVSVRPENDIVIGPNPSTGKFNVESLPAGQAGLKSEVSKLEVLNIMGEIIWKMSPSGGGSGGGISVDISNQPNGFYFLKVHTEYGMLTQKLIIQKNF